MEHLDRLDLIDTSKGTKERPVSMNAEGGQLHLNSSKTMIVSDSMKNKINGLISNIRVGVKRVDRYKFSKPGVPSKRNRVILTLLQVIVTLLGRI